VVASQNNIKVYTVRESAARFDSATNVDRENKVVRDVVVLGHESTNGRRYSESVMRAALEKYNGVPVRIDHPDIKEARATREFDTTWGWIENPRVVLEEGVPKIRADIRYLDSHPSTKTILERIEEHPTRQGLSHNADIDGDWTDGNSIFEVTDIPEVRSVDLVENPATTRGIFESRTPGGQNVATKTAATKPKRKMKLRGILEGADYLVGKPASITGKAVIEMFEEGDAAEMLDLEMEVEDSSSPEDGVKAGIRMAIQAVLDDESLSADELLSKIGALMTARDEVAGGGAATESEDEEAVTESEEEEGVATESRGRKQPGGRKSGLAGRLAALESELATAKRERSQAVLEGQCREMLDKQGIEATGPRIKALARCSDHSERVELIKDWPTKASISRPASSPSRVAMESKENFDNFDYSDPKAFGKTLR
jgi:hypothetical protein